MEIDLLKFLEGQAGNDPYRVRIVNNEGEELEFKEVGDIISDISGKKFVITKTVNGLPVDMEPILKEEGK